MHSRNFDLIRIFIGNIYSSFKQKILCTYQQCDMTRSFIQSDSSRSMIPLARVPSAPGALR